MWCAPNGLMSQILQKSTVKENEMHFISTHTYFNFDQPGMLAACVSVLLDTEKHLYNTWHVMAH